MNSSNNSNTYGLVTNQNENCEELEIDENVVGAVIGPAGTNIENSEFSDSKLCNFGFRIFENSVISGSESPKCPKLKHFDTPEIRNFGLPNL